MLTFMVYLNYHETVMSFTMETFLKISKFDIVKIFQ